ncbi:MAG: ribonuclease HI [Synergistaceae bacterium]|jgi:ribonuclease HI|nr:ribonuclease HI [Synergistaceae bacterium]
MNISRNISKKTKVTIYTDGGCTPNPGLGGWAAVLISPAHGNFEKEIYGSESDTTNNRMELTAAISALRALKYPCAVELHTDSMYMRNAFDRGWLTKWQRNGWKTSNKQPVLNQDLWEELLRLSRIHDVQWHWTRGHGDDALNNRCDALVQKAKEAHETSKDNKDSKVK